MASIVTFCIYLDFIEDCVQPIYQRNPDWISLDGRREGEPKSADRAGVFAYVIEFEEKFQVDEDARIKSLVTPYGVWESGDTDYPVALGKTRNGRSRLVPHPDSSKTKYFYLYSAGPAPIQASDHAGKGHVWTRESDDSLEQGGIAPLVMQDTKRAKRDQAFRRRIFTLWGERCALTGCEDVGVVDAAHINSHCKSGDNRASNGIQLRADLHRLMDLGGLRFIRVKDTVTVRIREDVRYACYRDLENREIKMPR